MSKKNIITGAILALIAVVVLAVFVLPQNKNKTGGEILAGPYDEFAQCLYSEGLRMYGSVTCSFCERQRALFGNSAHFIKEIECDPRNPNSETELCIAKNITHTPTWILEDESGNDIQRFDPGVLSLKKLSEISGCSLPENP